MNGGSVTIMPLHSLRLALDAMLKGRRRLHYRLIIPFVHQMIMMIDDNERGGSDCHGKQRSYRINHDYRPMQKTRGTLSTNKHRH